MRQRTITGILIAIAIITVVIFASEILFTFIVGIMVVAATIEMLRMFGEESNINKKYKVLTCFLTLSIYFAVVLLWYYTTNNTNLSDYISLPVIIIVVMLMVITALAMLVISNTFDTEKIGKILFTILYVSLGFASLSILRLFGRRFLVYLFLISATTDIFAYIFGIKFGKHKLAPKISPKKSWEGSIAGSVFGAIFSTVFALNYGAFHNWMPAFGLFFEKTEDITILSTHCSVGEQYFWIEIVILIIISFIGTIVGQVGDLVASKIKREYDIKDFGTIFPGHGGILDRFDSAIYLGLFLVCAFAFLQIVFPH